MPASLARNVARLQWLAHKFAAVSGCTTWSRASPKFKVLLPCFVRPRTSLSFDQWHVTRSPPIRKRIRVGRYNNKIYPFSSLWAGGIQQILQSDWFLERAEFSHPDRPSERNPSSWSIFVNELAVIVNLSPFWHFHKQLIDARLSLFTFEWQG